MKKAFSLLCFLIMGMALVAQVEPQPVVPSALNVFKNVVIASQSDRAIKLSPDKIISLFKPLSSDGFSFQEAKIIEYENQFFLIANYAMRGNQMSQAIGIPLIEENGLFKISRTVTPIKCSDTNYYCKCTPPICSCTREGGTHLEKCGKLIVGDKEIVSFISILEKMDRYQLRGGR